MKTKLQKLKILCLMLLVSSIGWGQTESFSIDFNTSTPNQTITAPTGITISQVGVSAGSISYGSFGTTFGGTPHAESSSGWMATTDPDAAKNFFFTITADPGITFDLKSVSSLVRSTNAGASDMALLVNGDLIDNVATPNSATPILNVSGTDFTSYDELTSVTIKIAGYDGGSRTSTGGGASRIGQIEGTIVVNLGSTPVLSSTESSIEDLDYEEGDGPSIEQSFSVSGENLDGSDVTVSLPASSDFELAETASGTYTNSITLTTFDGTATDVFVRLKSDLNVGTYADEITISGGGASPNTVDIEGEVFEPVFLLYDFIGDSVVPTQSPNNTTTSNFLISSANVTFGTTGTWSGSGTPYAQGNSGWGSTDVNQAKNFFFTIQTDAGYNLDLSSISFEWRTTGAGPSAITIEINGVEIATFDSGSNQQAVFNQSLMGFENLNSVEVRIKGWDNGSRSTSGGGDFRINDVQLDGNVNELTPDFEFSGGVWTPENPEDVSTISDIVLVLDGVAEITNTLEAGSLGVHEGATLNVNPTAVLEINDIITNNGTLVFQSDASGAGQLAEFTGTITGNVTVERFIPSRRAFRFLASPVSGVSLADAWQEQIHITGAGGEANGFDETATNNPSMFTYDAASQSWTEVTNTTTTTLAAGNAYRALVRGSRETVDLTSNDSPSSEVTLSATGELTTGNFPVPDVATNPEEFTFVGNPYQAMVDINAINFGDDVNDGFAYYWDAALADRGAFVTITLPGGANEVSDETIDNPGTSNANQFLRPGQAFFVRNNDSGSDFSIEFTEASKAVTADQTQVFSSPSNALAFINLRLYTQEAFTANEREQDALGLRFSANGNNAVDHRDAIKMGNLDENLASLNNEQLLSIENRSFPQNEEEVQLFTQGYTTDNYMLWLDVQNLPEGTTAFLKDAYNESTTELEAGVNEIAFEVDSSNEESSSFTRFSIVFEVETFANEEFDANVFSFYPNPVSSTLNINLGSTQAVNTQISVFDVSGRKVMEKSFTHGNSLIEVDASQLSSGLYFIEVKEGDQKQTHKLIKQ